MELLFEYMWCYSTAFFLGMGAGVIIVHQLQRIGYAKRS